MDTGYLQCMALLFPGLSPSLHSAQQWEHITEGFPGGILGPDRKVVCVASALIPLARTQLYIPTLQGELRSET